MMPGGPRREPMRPIKAAVLVPLRSREKAAAAPATVLGFVEKTENGRRVKTDESKEYTLRLMNEFEPTETVARPFAYLLPPTAVEAVATLKRHGLELQELREDLDLDVEVYKVDAIERSPRRFEGHHVVDLHVSPRKESRRVAAGTLLVRTSQPLGALAVYLLEPRSEDGLVTWNFFDTELKEGGDFPVLRLLRSAPMSLTGAEPLAEYRERPRPITFDDAGGGFRGRGGFGPQQRWLNGTHWLAVRDGKLMKVNATTGRSQPFFDPKLVAKGLGQIKSLDKVTIDSIARRTSFDMDSAHRGFLFEHGHDLYYATFDGSTAVRLTTNPDSEKWAQFSPDGKSVAFVRDHDLFAVDIVTQTERRLTTGGRDDLRHGEADWVYYEEIFNRRWPAFWWSPDSQQLALHGVR